MDFSSGALAIAQAMCNACVMQNLVVPVDLLADPRLETLRSEMAMSMAEAVGTLIIFLARTKSCKEARVDATGIGFLLPGPAELRHRLLAALQSSGFVVWERPSDPAEASFCSGRYFIVDHARSQLVREARARAGRASAQKRSVKKPARKTKQTTEQALVAPESKALTPAREANVACFEAYSQAYERHYHTKPQTNAQIRGMVAKLVQCVGAAEAPGLAAWYVTHTDSFYVRNTHRFGLLVSHWETLLTQYRCKIKITSADVRHFETAQKTFSQRDRIRTTMFREK